MQSADPLISIVIPNYNGGIFLEQTLLSIFRQGFSDFEVIVVDGGSVDLSLAIFERYMHRFSYFRSHQDDGQYEAINEGFAQAKGRILAWLNSDDLLHPGALRCMAKAFYDANSQYSLYTGLPCLFDASGRLVRIHQNIFGWSYEYFMSVDPFGDAHYMQQESTFFTRDLWEKVGGLRAEQIPNCSRF